ncbi:MAG: reverse transcriptase domain-containing protein [Chloroflexota bacterium]
MRRLDIIDLYDYYDFTSNIQEKAKEIGTQILKAQYRATSPLIYRLEKKYGICRHMMIPSPSDALVFQTITEHLAPLLEKAQPTKKAYYSRDKHTLKLPHQLPNTGYWSTLWPKYQKDILGFTDSCDYLVVTDITDFFDNIGLRELRHIVSSKIEVDEVVLDLLFNIIEQLSWLPDYLPTSLEGFPTINIEAFRLLPHVMLFEIDEVLNQYSQGNFVRWMDDINIGVNSKDEAHTILGNVNDVLKSRGLALNLSKTDIYTAAEAKAHFMFDENTYLDQVDKADPSDPDFHNIKLEFLKHFRHHLKNTNLRNWDKVTKRYFTVGSHLKIYELLDYAYNLYLENPEVRSNIILYMSGLKFTNRTAKLILDLLRDIKRHDDVSLYQLCQLIIDLNIPFTTKGKDFIATVDKLLQPASSDFDLYCYIWFLAKYGEPHIIMTLIERTKDRWRNEQFLARQVVSILPRCLRYNEEIVRRMLNEQIATGPRDAASVAISIDSLSNIEFLASHDKYLFVYLLPLNPQRPYPLSKYLILSTVLASLSLKPAERKKVVAKVKERIADRWYLHWLKRYSLLKV